MTELGAHTALKLTCKEGFRKFAFHFVRDIGIVVLSVYVV